jgi:pyruvate dehydrogenase E2 component (dihydrolipoamide acetyltransferase)
MSDQVRRRGREVTHGERVWADDGSMAVRLAVSATLSADHRATDGHIGARFLALVERLLHRPQEL